MAKDLFFGGEINLDPHEVLMQQGRSCRTTHRELAVADLGSLDVLIDVKSSCHVAFLFDSTGVFHGSFLVVTSHTIGAGTSLESWNRNTFFQAANSGFQSTEVIHTASYNVEDNRGDFILGTGGNKQNPFGGVKGDALILGPGQYAFKLQNKSGAAADIAFTMTWEEPTIPNVP